MSGKQIDGLLRRVLQKPLSHLSDQELLMRFVGCDDQEAFAAIVARHGPGVYGLCRRIVRTDHLAEEALQATFLVLCRKARAIQRQESLGGWLFAVAYRVA